MLVVAAIVVVDVAKEVADTGAGQATPSYSALPLCAGCYCQLSTCCQKLSPLNEYERLRIVDKSTQWSARLGQFIISEVREVTTFSLDCRAFHTSDGFIS